MPHKHYTFPRTLQQIRKNIVRHSSADVGCSWKSYLKSAMGKSGLHGFSQMSINRDSPW